MYADDHQIYEIGKGTCSAVSKLQQSVIFATDWYDSNLTQGNLKKYQTINIRNKLASNDKTCIAVKGKAITESISLKLLGVTIDSKLNFDEHINSICKKASQRNAMMMRLRNLIPTMTKLKL